MPHIARTVRLAASAVLLTLVLTPAPVGAQNAPGVRSPGQPPAAAPTEAATPADIGDFNAERVREQFNEVLEKYPPSLGRVLKLDPSLMSNDAYLAPYPGIADFLAQHPEVGRNPSYFLERIHLWEGEGYRPDAAAQKRREIQGMLAAFAAFVVFLVVVGVVIWLIRTILETRRWNRVSKTQAEVHTKLLDRFSSNEDLLAYIQTPVGRRFLESGPAPVAEDVRPVGAPFSRILLSIQAGVVLTSAALGMLFLNSRMDDEVSAFFLVIGVVTLAVGIGFLASSAAAYVISSRLGLMNRSDSGRA